MRSATLTLGAIALTLPLALLALTRPVQAQYFPLKGTIEEIEAEAERLEKEQQLKAAREAELQARAKENAERFKNIQADVKKRLSAQASDINKAEFKSLYADLRKTNSWFRLGELYYYLGAWKQSDLLLRQSLQTEKSVFVEDGWTMIVMIRCQVGDLVGDEAFDEKFAKRLDREIADWKKELDKSLAERNQRRRDQRERHYTDFKATLDKLPEQLATREKIMAEIQTDTWNSDAMWRLIQLYRNDLNFWSHARVWLEILKQYCPESQWVLNGEADLLIAEIYTRQGLYKQADELVAAAQSRVDQVASDIEAKLKAIDDKLKANPDYKLTPEELRISKLNGGRLRDDAKSRFDRTKKDIEDRRKQIEGEAGRGK